MRTIIAISALLLSISACYARGPSYGGGHHTSSHGGTFTGGSGSSHRGGHYSNPATGNQYGTHK